MSTRPQAGEVWYADLGLAAKGRPVLVLFAPGEEDARSLVVVAPLTSQIRHLRGEISIGKPKWLPKESAVNVQGVASFDHGKLSRRLGALPPREMERVKDALRDLLGL